METEKRLDSIERKLDRVLDELDSLHSLVVAIESGDVNLKKRGFWG